MLFLFMQSYFENKCVCVQICFHVCIKNKYTLKSSINIINFKNSDFTSIIKLVDKSCCKCKQLFLPGPHSLLLLQACQLGYSATSMQFYCFQSQTGCAFTAFLEPEALNMDQRNIQVVFCSKTSCKFCASPLGTKLAKRPKLYLCCAYWCY